MILLSEQNTEEKKTEPQTATIQSPQPPQPVQTTVDPSTAMSAQAQAPAAAIAKQIPVVPYSRPSPNKAATESGSVVVAKALAAQLLSDSRHLSQGIIDERKTAVLNDYTATALGYFSYRSQVQRQRFWGHVVGWELVASQGVDGRGRRDALNAMRAITGAQSTEVVKQPNLLARNIWKKDWKQKAESEGKEVAE